MLYAKPFLFLPDTRIAHFSNYYVPLCLSCHDLPKNIDMRYVNPENFAFCRFVDEQKKSKTFVDLTKSANDFLKKHQIKYVIIEKNAHDKFNFLTKETKTNRINKNQFVILN